MYEENITFSGQEAITINTEQITKAIGKLRAFPNTNVQQITHNCDNSKFLEAFGLIDTAPQKGGQELFGMRVFKKGWVPLNEVWLQDKEGKVLKKFKI
jgi:hypothetical protein